VNRREHPLTFHILPEQEAKTLAALLRELQPQLSWSQVKQAIQQRRVQVNGNVCVDEQRPLAAGNVIRLSEHPFAPPITTADVKLVHVDEHLVVVDKPVGVTTLRHSEERDWSSRRKNAQHTLEELVDLLLNPQAKASSHRVVKKQPRVRAVHRLDHDTSGVMVFARTPAAETALIRMFKKHDMERAYLAMVLGDMPACTINNYLIRDRGDGLRGSTTDAQAPDAQRAITHVKPLEKLAGYTVVECRLETGRTHQIRIHLSEAGHMLCGEKVYVRALNGPLRVDTSEAPRQMLHAAVLGFVHPITHQTLQFVSPLPRDFQKVLERLRRSSSA
jgi:23S rRNA pseudouridine1911/1915/1917 synthase